MFNSKYKKGMADAAKAYEAFGQKQEAALDQILEEVRHGNKSMEEALNEIGGNVDHLYDHLQSKEKAELYTIYTPFDIKELGSQEKLFLVGALLRLTTDKAPNENQQNYLRAIQRYLDIKEPPFGTDPLMIENIEDIPAQKAILQAVMEFLRLQDGDSYDETELQQEFLDAFSVNRKGRQVILKQVELLYNATGAQGLAEKYGYVPEETYSETTLEYNEIDEDPIEISESSLQKIAKEMYDIISNRTCWMRVLCARHSGVRLLPMLDSVHLTHNPAGNSHFFQPDNKPYFETERNFILVQKDLIYVFDKATSEKKVFPLKRSDELDEIKWETAFVVDNKLFLKTSRFEICLFDLEKGTYQMFPKENDKWEDIGSGPELLNEVWVSVKVYNKTVFVKTETREIHKIDFENQLDEMIFSSDKNFEILAATPQFIVLSQDDSFHILDWKGEDLSCTFTSNRDDIVICDKDSATVFILDCEESDDFKSTCLKLHRINLTDKKNECILSEKLSGDASSIAGVSLFNNALYILIREKEYEDFDSFSIFSIALDNPDSLKVVKRNLVIHSDCPGLARSSEGWVFVSSDYSLIHFSFRDNEAVILATDCGYDSEYRKHFWSTAETVHNVNSFHIIEDDVYFHIGSDYSSALVSIHEPMAVHMLE